MLFGGRQRQALRVTVHFRQRVGQRTRIAGQLGAAAVGVVLARARNGELNQHRRDRREDQHQKREHWIRVPSSRRPKNMPKCASAEIAPAIVAVIVEVRMSRWLDVSELVRKHPAQLARGQQLDNAGRRGDRGVLWIAAGGERIRLRFVDQVNPGHRQAGAGGELAHHPVELRCARRIDLPGIVELSTIASENQ